MSKALVLRRVLQLTDPAAVLRELEQLAPTIGTSDSRCIPLLLDLLQHRDEVCVAFGVAMLRSIKAPSQGVEAVVKIAGHRASIVRREVALYLSDLSYPDGDTLTVLQRFLVDGDPHVRINAARCVRNNDKLLAEAEKSLLQIVEAAESMLVCAVAQVIGEGGVRMDRVAAAILESVKSPAASQWNDERTLGVLLDIHRAGYSLAPAKSRLSDLLCSSVATVRRGAIGLLVESCSLSREDSICIRGLIDDEAPSVRGAAVDAVLRLKTERDELVPYLVGALGDTDANVRAQAAKCLELVGPMAVAAVPDIVKCASNERNARVLRHLRMAINTICREF